MKRSWMSFALSVGLALPALAWAKGGRPPGQSMEPGAQELGQGFAGSSQVSASKELGEIDLYIKDALNNARLLYRISDPSQGAADPTLVREQVVNIDRSLANIDKHILRLRSQPRAFDASKIDMVSRDVEQARSQLASLRSQPSPRGGIYFHDGSAELARTLERTDDDFGQLASSVGMGRVDQIRITIKQPVRGIGPEAPELTSPNVRGDGLDKFNQGKPEPRRNDSSPELGASPRY